MEKELRFLGTLYAVQRFGNAINMLHVYALLCISGPLQEDGLQPVLFLSFSNSLFQKIVRIIPLAGILEFAKQAVRAVGTKRSLNQVLGSQNAIQRTSTCETKADIIIYFSMSRGSGIVSLFYFLYHLTTTVKENLVYLCAAIWKDGYSVFESPDFCMGANTIGYFWMCLSW